ncbi:MAG: hypothetical protein QOI98_1548 [Solirubrobacteraceae bacterium]|nr:hypothetical protein [Solirubrobacteraceae bacterium]
MLRTSRAALLAGIVGLLALATPVAHGDGSLFAPPLLLPHGDPDNSDAPFYAGGEPSLAFDPAGNGYAYVVAPVGIPAGLGALVGADAGVGVAFWASSDHGRSFPLAQLTGTLNGGGDSDVEVAADGSVLVADLEAVATAICTSHDHGRTFTGCEGGVGSNEQGPDNDRQWLVRGTKGEIYLTYHDFLQGFPIIEKSTDGGATFTPCGTIIDPAGPATASYIYSRSTRVTKPTIGADGSIYVAFVTRGVGSAPLSGFSNAYMAVAKGGCSSSTVFANHVVYSDPGADLGKLFPVQGIDGGGHLYVAGSGTLKAGQTDNGMYLFTSADEGKTWSKPIQANPPQLKANVMPTVVGGEGAGEFAVGWFGAENASDPNDTAATWRYYAAVSYDGGKTLSYAAITPDLIHTGDICTMGTLCGLIPGEPGNRNLLDFASAALDPADGCVAIAFPGDPYNVEGRNTLNSSAYVVRQERPDVCLTKANAGLAAGEVAARLGAPAARSGCIDHSRPTSRFRKLARAAASSRKRVVLRGSTKDRGCGTTGKGHVSKVEVAVARPIGAHCRFVRPSGALGRTTSCTPRVFRPARGTATWRYTLRKRLAAGEYFAWARAKDAAGNVERAGTKNRLRFRVR